MPFASNMAVEQEITVAAIIIMIEFLYLNTC